VGNVEQYAGEDRGGKLELRVYPGANADFTLYEDEGVNYAYEEGVHSNIPFHWDEQLHRLTIGERAGAYPGMVMNRQFTVHVAGTNGQSDKQVTYTGKQATVEMK